jgi:hypothetical protein
VLISAEGEHYCRYRRVSHLIPAWLHLLGRLWIHSKNSTRLRCITMARITIRLKTKTTVVMTGDSCVSYFLAFQLSFWRWEALKLFVYRSPEAAPKTSRRNGRKNGISLLDASSTRLVYCFTALASIFPFLFPPCDAEQITNLGGHLSFCSMRMHCKYGL